MSPGELRHRFTMPRGAEGRNKYYFCGNSLGLQPDSARREVERELDRWARLGVEGHFEGESAWMPYHRLLTAPLARLAGAVEDEVVAMNSLTANLHLILAGLYRPSASRRKILIENGAFPSDRHAMASQLRFHGLDPATDLVEIEPGPDGLIPEDRVVDYLSGHGEHVALVLWPGVQYASGQYFDLERICRAGREAGCVVGLDLAHAIGNLPLALHDWGADFAVWCSYKYLNAGPGSVGGLFVHTRHRDHDGPRLGGWWGHDQDSRFRMGPDFRPMPGAEGWQLSNPPILAMAALRGSLEVFDEAGIGNLREASLELTGRMAAGIDSLGGRIGVLTPADPARRGCQLSLRLPGGRGPARELFDILAARGVVADWREPDIIRVAPVPLYNTLEDVDAFVELLDELA